MFKEELMLDMDFLINEMGYTPMINPTAIKVKFKDYYLNICSFIKNNFYLQPTIERIEDYITYGYYELDENNKHVCSIIDQSERIYIFKSAMAKQLIYDFENGRGSMIRDNEDKFNACQDMIDRIKLLGLYQRNICCV